MKVGSDLGYGFVKAVCGRGPGEQVMFQSVVGKARPRNLVTINTSTLENLHVHIEGPGIDGEYFVGDLARREAFDTSLTMDEDKVMHENTVVLLATSLALLAKGAETEVDLVTGLPVSHYVKQRVALEQRLRGDYTVTFMSGPLQGQQRRLVIRSARVFVQAAGAVYSEILGDDGRATGKPIVLDDGRPVDLTDSKIGVIDVGFKTTDYVVLERMRWVDLESSSVNVGMNTIFRAVQRELNRRFNYDLPLYNVESAVASGEIESAGKKYDVRPITEAAMQAIAKKILDSISADWQNRAALRAVLVAGGGGAALWGYLRHWDAMYLMPNAQMANALGYFKLANSGHGASDGTQAVVHPVG